MNWGLIACFACFASGSQFGAILHFRCFAICAIRDSVNPGGRWRKRWPWPTAEGTSMKSRLSLWAGVFSNRSESLPENGSSVVHRSI